MHDDKTFQKIAESYQVTVEEQEEITGNLSALCRMEEIRQFEETLEEMFSTGAAQDMSALLEKWKGNYRKNCRI
jgi:hypothetical protein